MFFRKKSSNDNIFDSQNNSLTEPLLLDNLVESSPSNTIDNTELPPITYYDSLPPEVTTLIGHYALKPRALDLYRDKAITDSESKLRIEEEKVIAEEKRIFQKLKNQDEDAFIKIEAKALVDVQKQKATTQEKIKNLKENETDKIYQQLLSNPGNMDIKTPLYEEYDYFKYTDKAWVTSCMPVSKGFECIAGIDEGRDSWKDDQNICCACVICSPCAIATCPVATTLATFGCFADGIRYKQHKDKINNIHKEYNTLFLQEDSGPGQQLMR